MLENSKLLIDQACPMCKWYGNTFEKYSWIEKGTVHFYQTADNDTFQLVDKERAKSEVALVDVKTGAVKYGHEAFIEIFIKKKRFLKSFLTLKPINWFVKKLYAFISYNRHVIISKSLVETERSCVPLLHKGYRTLYLVLVALFTALVLHAYGLQISKYMEIGASFSRELIICSGQILWQLVAISIIAKRQRWDYLGNMSTVSAIGGVSLSIILLINAIIPLGLVILTLGFLSTVGVMLFLHIKRCKKMQLPLFMSASWVLYRTVVLAIILVTLIQ